MRIIVEILNMNIECTNVGTTVFQYFSWHTMQSEARTSSL